MILVLTIDEFSDDVRVYGIYEDVETARIKLQATRKERIAQNEEWGRFQIYFGCNECGNAFS